MSSKKYSVCGYFLWSSLQPLTAHNMGTRVPRTPSLRTFDGPADLQSLINSTQPRNWITQAVSKCLAERPPRVQSVRDTHYLMPHIPTLLTFASIDSDLLEWSSRSRQKR